MDNRAARRRAAARRSGVRHEQVLGAAISRDGRPGAPRPDETRSSEAVEPEALVVSHGFDPGDEGGAYPASVRLTGRRIGVQGVRRPQDDFVQEDMIAGLLPGSGPVSVTSWVYGLHPGEWMVQAQLVRPGGGGRDGRATAEPIHRAAWSWRRWAFDTGSTAPLKTRGALLAPLAGTPGVMPGVWPILGALAVLQALVTQALILAHENAAVGQSLSVSLVALVSGMIGAKVWYAALHPGPWREAITGGWAVDGFLIVAPIVAIASLLASDLHVGLTLDAVVPGLFFAVAIGRIGCFLTGCCAGRTTRSRWGVWSSDRRVGARRIPAQLLESAAGLGIGFLALGVIFGHTPRIDGALFLGAFALYFVVRQALLRARAERREYSWRRRSTARAETA